MRTPAIQPGLLNRDVQAYRTASYWYAVGYNYAQLDLTKDRPEGQATPINEEAFSSFATGAAEAYHVEHTTSTLHSVPDLFTEWTQAGMPGAS